jgi:hypothetical protein
MLLDPEAAHVTDGNEDEVDVVVDVVPVVNTPPQAG